MCGVRKFLLCLGLVLPVAWANAGGSGLNVLVVVNQNSSNSVRLANEYCERRGVPPQNVFRMTNWTGGARNWSPADFERFLRTPLLEAVSARGLAQQAEFVLLSMDIPYRVRDGSHENGTTAALFYGFKTNAPAPEPGLPDSCSLPDDSLNPYAFSEVPLRGGLPQGALSDSFLTMMLTASNFTDALLTLNRGAGADGSFPAGPVYLAKTTDPARNVRYVRFDDAVFEARVAGRPALVRTNTNFTRFVGAFGLETGLLSYSVRPDSFLPGGLADNLTSYGGSILEDPGQTTLLALLRGGAAGSYGTVVEPCNYLEKFPDPLVYFYQGRGFSLAEAYCQSLRNPYQGLLVGEPLSAPFAFPARAEWESLTNGTILFGQPNLTVTFTSSATNLPVAKADLFVDGLYLRTLTNVPAGASNLVNVVLAGETLEYGVPSNSPPWSVAAGLAEALNEQTNVTGVSAEARGDRIMLRGLDPARQGSELTLQATTGSGGGEELTTSVNAAAPRFFDSIATGSLGVILSNAPVVDDWVSLQVTKTNGSIVSVGVTNAVAGTLLVTLARSLVDLVNAHPELQGPDGVWIEDFQGFAENRAAYFAIYARTPGWPPARLAVTLGGSTNLWIDPSGTNRLEDNLADLQPRNHLYVGSGRQVQSVGFSLDTTGLADGFHELAVVGYEGTSVRTQARVSRQVRVANSALSGQLRSNVVGTNVTTDVPLRMEVSANSPVSRIELFSTGGSLGVQEGKPSAGFEVSTAFLGLGLHPFYAVIEDSLQRRYQTETLWLRVIEPIRLSLLGQPSRLAWSSLPGHGYEVLAAPDPSNAFVPVDTVVATGTLAQWPLPPLAQTAFYRVRLLP